MQRRRLGSSGIYVSEICMGTMTFGAQADEAEGFRVMDRAYEAGVDFYDTAEVYPVPPTAQKVGLTEEIVGRWLKTKPRHAAIVATKVTGPAHGWFTAPVRDGHCQIDRHQILRSCEESLARLGTDYIDLYQVHWPDHGMRTADWLGALDELVTSGKVRAIGLSNETTYGLMKAQWEADKHGLTPIDSVQNNFSLINRRCQNELAQACRKEGVSLLPYSPIGGGVLSGKYNDGQLPADARFSAYLENGNPRQKAMATRFVNDRSCEVTRRFMEIGEEAGIDPVTLAVAWSKQHDFVASTIVGVSELAQLDPVLAAADLVLSDEVIAAIDQVDEEIPNPMTEDGLRRL